jgi:hypothetical protein
MSAAITRPGRAGFESSIAEGTFSDAISGIAGACSAFAPARPGSISVMAEFYRVLRKFLWQCWFPRNFIEI